jgi:hypothetical protein
VIQWRELPLAYLVCLKMFHKQVGLSELHGTSLQKSATMRDVWRSAPEAGYFTLELLLPGAGCRT